MLVHPGQAPYRAARTSKLDLREFERRHHISVVFERLDDVGPEDHLFVLCGYDPEPVRRKIEAWCPDEFEWSWIGTGPDVWAAEVTVLRHPEREKPYSLRAGVCAP
jgi:uncharacterized protein (DUF2249 family)